MILYKKILKCCYTINIAIGNNKILKNKLGLAFTFTFLLLTIMPAHADVFVCIDHGKKVMKNTDTCIGKVKGVYSTEDGYLSYSDYKAKQATNAIAASKIKNTKVVEPTLEELKARCNQDFDELATYSTHSKKGDRLLGTLTKNKCATTSVACYKDFDNFITDLKNGGGTHSHSGDKQMARNLRAKCGLPEEPFNPDDQAQKQYDCTPNGFGGMTCR